MKKITLSLTCLLAFFSTNVFSQNQSDKYFQLQPDLTANVDYVYQTIILKLKPEYRDVLEAGRSNVVASLLNDFKVNRVDKKFIQSAVAMRQAAGVSSVDLSLIYEIKVDASVNIEEAINKLHSTGMLEYAEPNYISYLQYTPNDPLANDISQYHLGKIHAYEAWDIEKGDSTVIIGFSDTGTALKHRDLKNNIKKNWADPVNGVDDDADGYIDNFQGFDLAQNDNNTQTDPGPGAFHGAHVTGCGTAQTNNGAGLAGAAFNCKYLPVKISDTSAGNILLTKAYEGIVYAADHGAQIINCSWGRNTGGFSQSQQDVVTYATDLGALVLSSSGNWGTSAVDYPASYKYVLSVASTDKNDVKATSSAYGSTIDLCAPGHNINSSIAKDTFLVVGGTSMACGVASGCAGLVKARFPWYNGLQIGEQLKATADNIDALNPSYKGMLGTGRINLFRAVTETPPMISMPSIIKTDYANDIFSANDTVDISGEITNFLDTTEALKVTLRTTSSYITIIDSTSTIGVLNTLDTTDNYADPFTVYVKPGTPGTIVTFQLVFTDSNYVAYQTFTVQIASSISILENNTTYSALAQNYPNPAGTATTIEFELKSQVEAELTVYDVTGRKVETVVESEELSAGKHSYNFNTERLPNGIYYYSLRAGELIETRKMVVLRK